MFVLFFAKPIGSGVDLQTRAPVSWPVSLNAFCLLRWVTAGPGVVTVLEWPILVSLNSETGEVISLVSRSQHLKVKTPGSIPSFPQQAAVSPLVVIASLRSKSPS